MSRWAGRIVCECELATTSTKSAIRCLSSVPDFTPIPTDLEHYTDGWNVEDIDEFTQSGKYNLQTFNKISEKLESDPGSERLEIKMTTLENFYLYSFASSTRVRGQK